MYFSRGIKVLIYSIKSEIIGHKHTHIYCSESSIKRKTTINIRNMKNSTIKLPCKQKVIIGRYMCTYINAEKLGDNR